MIKLEKTEVLGWEHSIRGMRNPLNSWDKSDSTFKETAETEVMNEDGKIEKLFVQFDALAIGPNDLDLMKRLRNAGSDHRKFMRMIVVYVDITAPLYWWKEFDTYKVGTVANSCSTMHKIHEKEFTLEDFSCEHLINKFDVDVKIPGTDHTTSGAMEIIGMTIDVLNGYRKKFLETKDKKYWWQMIQLLPTSYNQKRTVELNYEVLANIYKSRKDHKLDEWHVLCDWIKELPYSELIVGEE